MVFFSGFLIPFCLIKFVIFMKRKLPFFVVAASLTLFLSACTSKPFLPQNPKDKEEKKDENGNRWVYNSGGGYWMVFPYNSSGYSSGAAYNYYPGTGSWTNSSGIATTPPASIPQSAYKPSVKPNSKSFSPSNKPKSSASGKVFSSGSRSRSFSA